MNNDQNSLKLASLLDTIDRKNDCKYDGAIVRETMAKEYAWVEYVDPTSGKPYYYNYTSKITQWEKPANLELRSSEDSHRSTEDTIAVSPRPQVQVDDIPYGWVEHYDSVSKQPYYYNMILKTTQWAKPKGFEALPGSTAAAESTEYTEKAYFSKESGKFSGTSSYWQKV